MRKCHALVDEEMRAALADLSGRGDRVNGIALEAIWSRIDALCQAVERLEERGRPSLLPAIYAARGDAVFTVRDLLTDAMGQDAASAPLCADVPRFMAQPNGPVRLGKLLGQSAGQSAGGFTLVDIGMDRGVRPYGVKQSRSSAYVAGDSR